MPWWLCDPLMLQSGLEGALGRRTPFLLIPVH